MRSFEQIIAEFENAWQRGERPEIRSSIPSAEAVDRALLLELIHIELEYRLKAGDTARVEDYLRDYPELSGDSAVIMELAAVEYELRQRTETVDLDAFLKRFPGDRAELARKLKRPRKRRADRLLVRVNCPHCRNPIAVVDDGSSDELTCPSCGSSFNVAQDHMVSWDAGRLPSFGKFQLLASVGRGAFGTVYRARDMELDRIVAVKIPRSGQLASREDEDRFLREARSAAQLRHPGIVPVYEVGRGGEFPYLVSEFVEGVTLDSLLTARSLSVRESVDLLAQVADAVQHAHDQGVVHRDLKPSNIMLEQSSDSDSGNSVRSQDTNGSTLEYRPRVMDFGLARRDEGEITVTIEGQVLGTPAYMSPEQARGESHRVDGRSDIYSLGVILYELLAGERPFRGNKEMLLHQLLHEDHRPLRRLNNRIPKDLETITQKCLSKDPRGRYATCSEFAADLRRFLRGEPILARPIGRLERAWRFYRRNTLVTRLSAMVVLSLLAGILVFWVSNRKLDIALRLNQLQGELKESTFSGDELLLIEADVAAINQLSTVAGARARGLLGEALEERIRGDFLSLPAATDESSLDRIEAAIENLRKIAPERAGALLELRQKRLTGIVRVVDAPRDMTGVFDTGVCEVRSDTAGAILVRSMPVSANSDLVVPTRISVAGSERCDVAFRFEAETAARPIGVFLNFRPPADAESAYRGYLFRIHRSSDTNTGGRQPELRLGIWRGETLLREEPVTVLSDATELTLSVARSGQLLRARVNDSPWVEFLDVFAEPETGDGVFALLWPADVTIRQFTASGTKLADETSELTPMMRGQQLFAQKRWEDARAAFEEAEQRSDAPIIRQEAVFRRALCLLQSDPGTASAVDLLSGLAVNEDVAESRWPLLAACQWWQYLLKNERFDDAEVPLAILHSRDPGSRKTFEELAAILPSDIRSSIVQKYLDVGAVGGYESVRPHPERRANIERIMRLSKLLPMPERTLAVLQKSLARSYMEEGKNSDAHQVFKDLLSSELWLNPEYSTDFEMILDQHVWNLLLLNDGQTALDDVDRFLISLDATSTTKPISPYVSRARALVFLKRHEEALQSIGKALEFPVEGPFAGTGRAEALLVGGFILEELQRPEEAQEYWRKGRQVIIEMNLFRVSSLYASLLCSLSGQMTPEDTDRVVAGVSDLVQDGGVASAIFNFIQTDFMEPDLFHGVLSHLWTSKRGRLLASQIALQRIDFDRANYAQVLLCGYVAWRHAMTGSWEDFDDFQGDEELLLWNLCEESFQAYRRGEISELQVVNMAMAYNGTPYFWNLTKTSVPRHVRGPLDFIHGRQYWQRFQRPDDARAFLESAISDAADSGNAVLEKLARAELAKLP